jgi:hypothetical protein
MSALSKALLGEARIISFLLIKYDLKITNTLQIDLNIFLTKKAIAIWISVQTAIANSK